MGEHGHGSLYDRATMRRLGIVDIGSNTIRLVVYARQAAGGFRLRDDMRERVRLGAGSFRRGSLDEGRIDRAILLLQRFADYAQGARLDDLEVIGTSALRDADNGRRLTDAARAMGLHVQLLSGEDEAKLGVLAVANGFDLDDAWVMDLGGGSAQLSRMKGRRFVDGGAHPLGAVRLTEAFLSEDPPTAKALGRVEKAIAAAMGSRADVMREDRTPLVAMGGSVRNLARAVQKSSDYPLDLLHGFWLPREALEAVTERLLEMPVAKRENVAGIHPDRADVIVAAALVYRWVLRATDRPGLLVSGLGVREGVLYRHVLRPPHLVSSIPRASVAGWMEQFDVDHEHAASVAGLAVDLFDQLGPLHGLGPRDRVLLDTAASLHEIGLAIHYYRRQHHGAFLLRGASLDGFTHREQALIMLLVRYHRKGSPRLGAWKTLMSRDDKARLLALVACLRLAISLDRARGRRIEAVQVRIKSNRLVLEVPVAREDSVELWDLGWHGDIVERAFDRSLTVRAVAVETPARDPRERPRYGSEA